MPAIRTGQEDIMGKFRDHMEREMQIRGFSPRTQESYLWEMRKFVRKVARPADEVKLEDVNGYLADVLPQSFILRT